MGLDRLKRNWDELGRSDPFWAVLTWPSKRGGGWDPEEFFRTGTEVVAGLLQYLDALGIEVARGRALDFGCGAGRCTQALAEHFDQVCGVDIAPSMIEVAQSYNRHGERCRYVLNDRADLSPFEDGSFDFLLSLITLQHMPPSYAKQYLREFVRVLAPDGVAVFQTAGEPLSRPTAAAAALRAFVRRLTPGAVLDAYRKRRYGHSIGMYGMPRAEVQRVVAQAGGRMLDVVEDTSGGGGWTSYRYSARKEAQAP